MKKSAVHVTDHAVIRYLERVLDCDVEALRGDIRTIVDQAARCGATSITVDGFNYRLCGKTVVTIVHKGTANGRTGGKR